MNINLEFKPTMLSIKNLLTNFLYLVTSFKGLYFLVQFLKFLFLTFFIGIDFLFIMGFDFIFYSGVKGILSWSKDSNSSHVEKDGVTIPQRRWKVLVEPFQK